jgi:hypothetical protein
VADPFAPVKGLVKMIGLQIVHGIISGRKWKKNTKLIMFVLAWFANMKYSSNTFIRERPETLYDAFNVGRHATYEEFTEAKDRLLADLALEIKAFNKTRDDAMEVLRLNSTDENPQWELKNATMNMTLDSKFGMTAQDVNDSFYLVGTPALKEAYDKHN